MTGFYTHFALIIRMLYNKIKREKRKVIIKVEFRIQNMKGVCDEGKLFTKRESRLIFDLII